MDAVTIKGVGDGSRPLTVVKVLAPYLADDPTSTERIYVLTGRRRKPDILSWSGGNRLGDNGDYEVCCQGLYHGRYADAKVAASDLYRFMAEHAPREAASFLNAWVAWAEKDVEELRRLAA
jgi:hypothetical protein